MSSPTIDKSKLTTCSSVENDWGSALNTLVAEYGYKRQQIQDRYREKENQAHLELKQAELRELGRLRREHQQEVKYAKGRHEKSLAEATANLGGAYELVASNKEVWSRSSHTMRTDLSSPQILFSHSKTSVESDASSGLDDPKDSSSDDPFNADAARLSLTERKANNTWNALKRRRAELISTNSGRGYDSSIDNDTEESDDNDDDIPVHLESGVSKRNRKPDVSSPSAHRALKPTGRAGTVHGLSRIQRRLAHRSHSPPSGQAHKRPRADPGSSQAVRRNNARNARPKDGVMKLKAPPRLRRP